MATETTQPPAVKFPRRVWIMAVLCLRFPERSEVALAEVCR